MNISLEGKTALVTGGVSGIGRAISLALARCGADIAITYFHQDNETRNEIRAMGRKASSLYLDATSSAEVNQVFAQAAQALGGHIDILVNNAGHLVGRVPIAEMSDEHWHKVVNVNLSSAFYCARAVLPYMNTGWGRIVNSSSLAARDGGGSGAAAYAAAKAGILGLTRGLAKELAEIRGEPRMVFPPDERSRFLEELLGGLAQKVAQAVAEEVRTEIHRLSTSADGPGTFSMIRERYLPRPSWVIPRSTFTPRWGTCWKT